MRARLLYLFFMIILGSRESVAAPVNSKKINSSSSSIGSIINSSKLRVSKKDKRIANNIATVYKVSQKGYLNNRTIVKLIKEIDKNKTFEIYKYWLADLNKISSYKSLSAIKNLCAKISKKKPNSPVLSKLLYSSKQLCFQKYLDKLAHKHIGHKSLKKEMTYFSQFISQFISHNNLGELKYLLSKYKSSPARLKLFSNALTSYFLNQQTVPNRELLRHMIINHELTKFIQQNGLDQGSTKQILYSEFSKLIEDTYESADNNDDNRVVKRKAQKAINYFNLSLAHLPLTKSTIRLIGLGKSLMRRNYLIPSRLIFSSVITNSSEYRDDALFELLWTYLVQENYDDAFEEVVSKYSIDKNFKDFNSSKLKFWTAYTLKEEGENNFEPILLNIIETDPVSYYSIISSKLLQETRKISSNRAYLKLLSKNNKKRLFTNLRLDPKTYHALKRLKVWSILDFKTFINSEARSISIFSAKDISKLNPTHDKSTIKDFTTFLTASILASTENHLEVFKVIYRGLNSQTLKLDDDVLALLYPMPYWDKIKKYAQVDPIIPLSLIRQESAFNKQARSHVGARGLMQLMPNTAKVFKKKLRKKQLYNPNINLKIGNQYFAELMSGYDQNLVYSLSAYNAGEGRVKRWRSRYLTSDSILHNLENIPFSETRKYVKLIFRNIFFYKLINDENAKLDLVDSKDPNKIFDVYLGFNK